MKRVRVILLVLLSTLGAAAGETLSGHVYEGAIGSTTPLANVTVRLVRYQGVNQVTLASTVTSATGAYSLTSPNLTQWEYVDIIETDPPNYVSVGANSKGGTVINANTIRYTRNDFLKQHPLTDNDFWDQIQNTKPVADADGPYYGLVNRPITLDGSGSYDPDPGDRITAWYWDTNGNHAFFDPFIDRQGERVDHTWVSPYDGWIYLLVYDTHDAKDTDSARVVVSSGWDFGDAPNPYPTTLAQNGGAHLPGPVKLGGQIDVETDGQPSAIGLGDDNNGVVDDEDGAAFLDASDMTLSPGRSVSAEVKITHTLNPGRSEHVIVVGWLDFNRDGRWDDAPGSEEEILRADLWTGTDRVIPIRFSFTVPPNASLGHTFARFRLFIPSLYETEIKASGFGGYGEVEDYFFNIMPLYDFGDAPAPFPTSLLEDGARHLVGRYTLGNRIDGEADGMHSIQALGDDANGSDDEDGVQFTTMTFVRGEPFQFDVIVPPVPDAELPNFVVCGWLDFNGDGDWSPVDELLFAQNGSFASGTNVHLTGTMAVPAGLPEVAARFRLYACQDPAVVALSPKGFGGYGEVEDYLLTITDKENFDFGDAADPYPTRFADGGACHRPDPYVHLGEFTDVEPDGQPDIDAQSDDINGSPDDEDGVVFDAYVFSPGEELLCRFTSVSLAQPQVRSFVLIAAWIDFDRNGQWTVDEQITLPIFPIMGGTRDERDIRIPIPPSAAEGRTFARVRQYVSPDSTELRGIEISPYKMSTCNGEVEDYALSCVHRTQFDYSDAPLGYAAAWHPTGGPWLGNTAEPPDSETGVLSNMAALGDDLDGIDDENGLLDYSLVSGGTSNVLIACVPFSGHTADVVTLSAWIDFNGNRNFENPGERVLNILLDEHECVFPLVHLPHTFTTPFLSRDQFILRLRIQEGDHLLDASPNGAGSAGEVEDHLITVQRNQIPPERILYAFKFNDANGNGTFDIGESDLPNWTFYLDMNDNGRREAGEPFAVTDAWGIAFFYNPPEGRWKLREDLIDGWERTRPAPEDFYWVDIPHAGVVGPPFYFGNRQVSGRSHGCLKWEQPPLYPTNEEPTWYAGKRVKSIFGEILAADDWYCNNPTPIIGVTWWGAYDNWREKVPPPNAPNKFLIGIADHSLADHWEHPGEGIYGWVIERPEFSEELVDSLYSPGMAGPISCFRYTFNIPDFGRYFFQQGDSTHYWLTIAAIYDRIPEQYPWGWVSREHYFHADAVNVLDPVSPTGPIRVMRSRVIENNLDLTFLLHTTDCRQNMDFGDAFGSGFRTLKEHNAAKHLLHTRVFLGRAIDAEPNGQQTPNADGDDLAAIDDEDGISSTFILPAGDWFKFSATASCPGYLHVWADLNRNSRWESEELIFRDRIGVGVNQLQAPVRADAQPGSTTLRFRFTTESLPLPPYGLALDGEVEDYPARIQEGESAFLPRHWGMITNTGSNATIIIPTAARPSAAGDTLRWGDYIGAFTREGICCGRVRWYGRNVALTVWGDDPMTTDRKEGFATGEEILYRVFSPERQLEFSNIEVQYAQGNGRYAADAIMVISRFVTSTEIEFSKTFTAGWNGFSFNINNTDHRVEDALASTADAIVIMKDGLGKSWLPEYGINTLGALDYRKGYKVLMRRSVELRVCGEPVDPTAPIALRAGWNLIGYLPQFPASAELCFASLGENLILAKDNYGHSFIPEFGINTLGELLPGEAYNLFMRQATDFSYPRYVTGMSKKRIASQAQPVHFVFRSETGENAIVVIPAHTVPQYSNGTPLAIGDEIAAMTPEGICCGAIVWEGVNSALTIWADDGMTPQKDGFYEGDSLRFVIWCKEKNKEIPARAESSTPLVFQIDQIFVLSRLIGVIETGTSSSGEVPAHYALRQNYPNPFNPITRIEYDLPEEEHVRLLVLNLSGQQVVTLVDERQKPGRYAVVWNGASFSSGIYVCRLEAGNFTAYRKMLLIK